MPVYNEGRTLDRAVLNRDMRSDLERGETGRYEYPQAVSVALTCASTDPGLPHRFLHRLLPLMSLQRRLNQPSPPTSGPSGLGSSPPYSNTHVPS